MISSEKPMSSKCHCEEHLPDGSELSVYKFCEAVDTLSDDDLTKFLEYFDSINIVLCDLLDEACIYDYQLTFDEMFYTNLIKENAIQSFRDLINY
jgi:hypothetical protein